MDGTGEARRGGAEMSRDQLLHVLRLYEEENRGERPMVERVRRLISEYQNCFERECLPGHITASSWIFSHDRTHFLLTHHRKLGRWLQLGGHADGDANPLNVALREAREESGMVHFDRVDRYRTSSVSEGFPIPADLDVHRIPSRPGEPEHEHYDFRFILVARLGQPLVISEESSDLAWFRTEELEQALDRAGADESLLRLGRKALACSLGRSE